MNAILRNKSVTTLITLMILGVIIGVAHNRAFNNGTPFFIRDCVRFVVMPSTIAVHKIINIGRQTIAFIRPRTAILRENAMLRQQVRILTEENARLREAASENVRLRKMLDLRKQIEAKPIVAEVISRDVSRWFDTAMINKGYNDGVCRGAAVVNHLGLVGQIIEVGPNSAQVVSITDQDSGIGGMVQRSRTVGFLQGQSTDIVQLSYLPKDADVNMGDLVVSSGNGGVIPKGITIGRVVNVVRNAAGGTTTAFVRPSVKFDQVEQVFILIPEQNMQK